MNVMGVPLLPHHIQPILDEMHKDVNVYILIIHKSLLILYFLSFGVRSPLCESY